MSEGYYSVSSEEGGPEELLLTDEQIEMLGTGQLGDILGLAEADEETDISSGSDSEDLEAELASTARDMQDICTKISHLLSRAEALDNALTAAKIHTPWGTFQRYIWQEAGLGESEDLEDVLGTLQRWVWDQGYEMSPEDGSWEMNWEGGKRRMTWIGFVVAMLE
jgi:hypothetical protein